MATNRSVNNGCRYSSGRQILGGRSASETQPAVQEAARQKKQKAPGQAGKVQAITMNARIADDYRKPHGPQHFSRRPADKSNNDWQYSSGRRGFGRASRSVEASTPVLHTWPWGTYQGHNYIGHNYIGHKYMRHSYTVNARVADDYRRPRGPQHFSRRPVD